METLLLIIVILLLAADIDERRTGRSAGSDAELWEEAGKSESRVRSLTDRAVLAMMNEVRRSQHKQP